MHLHVGSSLLLTCDVIDDHSHCRVSYVAWDEAPEALLSSCVPQLQPYLRMHTQIQTHTFSSRFSI